MQKLILIFIILAITSCSSGQLDNQLIIPPYFAEVPDANSQEKPSEKQKEADIERLKDLLLKSE